MVDRFNTDLTDTTWRVGYAPDQWDALVKHLRAACQATDLEMVDAGLAKWSRRDTLIDVFRNRAMIGLTDADGTLRGFTGRDLSSTTATDGYTPPKYLNTPTTAAFVKGAHLYGLHEGRSAARGDDAPGLVRVEGPMGAIGITLAGEGRLTGTFPGGTALTDQQADLLAVHSPGRMVWTALDSDAAGARAAEETFWKMTSRGLDTRTIG